MGKRSNGISGNRVDKVSALWYFYFSGYGTFTLMNIKTRGARNVTDLSDQTPDLVPYLLPHERVIAVIHPKIERPQVPPLALSALMKLTNASTKDEVGEHGPPVAAVATEENRHIAELNLFETLFGRDSLIVSMFLLPQFPKLARATVLALAKLQGIANRIANEEEPGRILHEMRAPDSPIGKELREKNGWEFPYYGSVDATALFVNLTAAYVEQEGASLLSETFTDREGKERTLLDAFDGAIGWIVRRLDANPDGLLEFCRAHPGGIANQAWKDSGDSYFHKDGTLADHAHGIASIEVQGYTYDALRNAGALYKQLNRPEAKIAELTLRAGRLQRTVLEKFWVDDELGGYFALGTDRDKNGVLRKLEIRTSNMGHLLSSRLLDGNDPDVLRKRSAIVETLGSPLMQNVSGIRTLAKNERRFKPGSYHNGSVWLWDSYYISRGLRRHGFTALADNLVLRMFSVVKKFNKFPEFARGGDAPEPELNERIVDVWDEIEGHTNRIEQPPQEIQAWTVAAVLAAEHEQRNRLNNG